MKLAVLSDIHGNMDALEAVLRDLDDRKPDDVFCLGDNIGYGAESEKVVRFVQNLGIPTVLGNHEQVLTRPEILDWFNPLARESLQSALETLSDESLDAIRNYPPATMAAGCRFVHGFPPDHVKTYLFAVSDADTMRMFHRMAERVCFVGHTHNLLSVGFDGRKLLRRVMGRGPCFLDPDCRYVVNVGSVGQPRDGDNTAKYVLWDAGENLLEIRFVPYDIEAAVRKILAAGLPRSHALRLR